jgi:hypothetical protein
MVRAALAKLRAASPTRPITVTYTDLPHNDFSALFRLVHGLLPAYQDNPIGGQPGVFTFASGTSFYRQIFPANSVTLGFSATAMHWISRLPLQIADHVHAVGASAAEKKTLHAAAMDDWQTILLHRARELKPGGKLVMANFCQDEQGRYLGNTGGINMHDTFAKHWRALHQQGVISAQEYRGANFVQYYKTKEDFAAPFADPASPVSKAGLVLEQVFTRVTGCPYAAEFAQHGDAALFAKNYVPTLRSWSESTFLGGLDPARPAAERMAIVDKFYNAYEAEVAAAPQGHAMDYVHCFMVVGKRQ